MGRKLLDILEKLLKLKEYIKLIERIYPNEFKIYQNDIMVKSTLERYTQLSVDLAVSINNIILEYLGELDTLDYYSSFIRLGVKNVIPIELAIDIASTAGLRNRLVHDYENTNDEVIYKSIAKMIQNYKKYMLEIEKYTS